jgi:hypothetical protein
MPIKVGGFDEVPVNFSRKIKLVFSCRINYGFIRKEMKGSGPNSFSF